MKFFRSYILILLTFFSLVAQGTKHIHSGTTIDWRDLIIDGRDYLKEHSKLDHAMSDFSHSLKTMAGYYVDEIKASPWTDKPKIIEYFEQQLCLKQNIAGCSLENFKENYEKLITQLNSDPTSIKINNVALDTNQVEDLKTRLATFNENFEHVTGKQISDITKEEYRNLFSWRHEFSTNKNRKVKLMRNHLFSDMHKSRPNVIQRIVDEVSPEISHEQLWRNFARRWKQKGYSGMTIMMSGREYRSIAKNPQLIEGLKDLKAELEIASKTMIDQFRELDANNYDNFRGTLVDRIMPNQAQVFQSIRNNKNIEGKARGEIGQALRECKNNIMHAITNNSLSAESAMDKINTQIETLNRTLNSKGVDPEYRARYLSDDDEGIFRTFANARRTLVKEMIEREIHVDGNPSDFMHKLYKSINKELNNIENQCVTRMKQIFREEGIELTVSHKLNQNTLPGTSSIPDNADEVDILTAAREHYEHSTLLSEQKPMTSPDVPKDQKSLYDKLVKWAQYRIDNDKTPVISFHMYEGVKYPKTKVVKAFIENLKWVDDNTTPPGQLKIVINHSMTIPNKILDHIVKQFPGRVTVSFQPSTYQILGGQSEQKIAKKLNKLLSRTDIDLIFGADDPGLYTQTRFCEENECYGDPLERLKSLFEQRDKSNRFIIERNNAIKALEKYLVSIGLDPAKPALAPILNTKSTLNISSRMAILKRLEEAIRKCPNAQN